MKKNKLKEGALNTGIQSYQTSSVNKPSSDDGSKKPTLNIKKNDLTKVIPQIKNDDVDVNVVESEVKVTNKKLDYLSDVKDAKTGEISKPFTINGKNYQMVRALTPQNEKVLGVYSLDEVGDDGLNVIHQIDEFEKLIDDSSAEKKEKIVEKEPSPKEEKSKDITSVDHPSFAGHKHFIVNKKIGKARKFKDIAELAKANMSPDEQYMGIKDFKKYVDETLFGAGKKQPIEEDLPATGDESDEEMNLKAKKLIDIIKSKIPENIIKTIVTPVAQREVIAAFAELIGVPRNGLSTLIAGLKDLALNKDQQPVTESRKIIQTIKVKDFNGKL